MNIPNLAKPAINWDIRKKIFIKENVISDELCDELIAFGADNVGESINKYPGVFDVSFHACLLPINHKVHTALQPTWAEVKNLFNIDISFIEPYELKRYTPDDFFGRHIDNYYSLTVNIDRKITMSIQLSNDDDYTDGELVVINEKIKLKKGSIVCFPSFFPHEVTKISTGTRWSLIGWAWGSYWK